MCCFSRAVEHVGQTKIFARAKMDGRQVLVYSMNLRIREPLAMILPLPVPADSAEDAVRFIDLSGYANFFDDLKAAFPPMFAGPAPVGRGVALAAPVVQTLAVHEVGDFEASFVPRVRDFSRLDERFRLAPDAFDKLPLYSDWGFAVFQLAPKKGLVGRAQDQTIHPMAFEFPRRDPSALFFPTVHIHDGTVHPRAHFDHTLYCQDEGIIGETLDWQRSHGSVGAKVDELRARGVVRGDRVGFARPLFGERANRDVVLRAPAWTGPDTLHFAGDCWSARIHAAHAYLDEDEVGESRRIWCETSRNHLDQVFTALKEGIPYLVGKYGSSWGLAPYPGEIPSPWPARYPNTVQKGPFLFNPAPSTKRVEHQEVVFSFAERPRPDVEEDIEKALRWVLNRALPS
jgi:hypothetical protein